MTSETLQDKLPKNTCPKCGTTSSNMMRSFDVSRYACGSVRWWRSGEFIQSEFCKHNSLKESQ